MSNTKSNIDKLTAEFNIDDILTQAEKDVKELAEKKYLQQQRLLDSTTHRYEIEHTITPFHNDSGKSYKIDNEIDQVNKAYSTMIRRIEEKTFSDRFPDSYTQTVETKTKGYFEKAIDCFNQYLSCF